MWCLACGGLGARRAEISMGALPDWLSLCSAAARRRALALRLWTRWPTTESVLPQLACLVAQTLRVPSQKSSSLPASPRLFWPQLSLVRTPRTLASWETSPRTAEKQARTPRPDAEHRTRPLGSQKPLPSLHRLRAATRRTRSRKTRGRAKGSQQGKPWAPSPARRAPSRSRRRRSARRPRRTRRRRGSRLPNARRRRSARRPSGRRRRYHEVRRRRR